MSQPIKPNQNSVPRLVYSPEEQFDVEVLLNKAGAVLTREIDVLLRESSKSMKLDASSSRDLVQYIKLLNEIREAQKDELKSLSNEQLEEIAKRG